MSRAVAPLIALATVAALTFGLAQWTPFAPSVPKAAAGASAADVYLGETLFANSCAECHGELGAGGGVGPKLAGSGLAAADALAVITTGRGVMPAGIVSGSDAQVVAAYVALIAASG
jgi:mono/diheme cytochrome c family protein